jgi:small neutral amino acid transporter SnatA (MarC family)
MSLILFYSTFMLFLPSLFLIGNPLRSICNLKPSAAESRVSITEEFLVILFFTVSYFSFDSKLDFIGISLADWYEIVLLCCGSDE